MGTLEEASLGGALVTVRVRDPSLGEEVEGRICVLDDMDQNSTRGGRCFGQTARGEDLTKRTLCAAGTIAKNFGLPSQS